MQEILIQHQPSLIGTTKVAQVEQGESLITLADRLDELAVKDSTLGDHRDQLVRLYRHSGELTLTETTFMEADGSIILTSAVRETYEQVSEEARQAFRETQTERNALRLYCSLQ